MNIRWKKLTIELSDIAQTDNASAWRVAVILHQLFNERDYLSERFDDNQEKMMDALEGYAKPFKLAAVVMIRLIDSLPLQEACDKMRSIEKRADRVVNLEELFG